MSNEIKNRHHTYGTDPAICPSCGEPDQDCWELFRDGDDPVKDECDCGARYTITREVVATYYTTLINEGEVIDVKKS